MEQANQITEAYKKRYGSEGSIAAALIQLAWLLLACEKKKENPRLIELLFESIDMTAIFAEVDPSKKQSAEDIRNRYFRIYYSWFFRMGYNFSEFKEDVVKNKSDAEKFACIEEFLEDVRRVSKLNAKNIHWNPEINRVVFAQ